MIGSFHTILSYLAIISASFKDTDIREIIVQSKIVAEGSGDTIFTGRRAHKRTARVYEIFYEAIFRLLLEEYEAENPSLCQKIQQHLQNIDE